MEKLQAEKTAFEESGSVPRRLPFSIRTSLSRAVSDLERAYKEAADGYTALAKDKEAKAILDELTGLQKSTQVDQQYLSAMKIERKSVMPGRFSTKGVMLSPETRDVRLKLDGEELSHSIFLHAPPKGVSSVTYRLGKKWERFRGAVFIPRVGDETGKIGSKITFQCMGDGEVLWTSDGIQEFDVVQEFNIDVSGVELLELRSSAVGSNAYGRAVWIEPTLEK